MKRIAIFLFSLFLLAIALPVSGRYALPHLPEPELYGTLTLGNVESLDGRQPVIFPHWLHRYQVTCNVCHDELGIAMGTGQTGMTEAAIRAGEYCGACHNGEVAFAPEEDCQLCHGGYPGRAREYYLALFDQRAFPSAEFGNRVDWVASLERGLIKPVRSLDGEFSPMNMERTFRVDASLTRVPPAEFSHGKHTAWLNCSQCHPELFSIKKDATKYFSMNAILEGEFCGVCHLRVAFPMDDCRRCHVGMRAGK